MRKLLYIPIIHTESDLGSAGLTIGRISSSFYGAKRWDRHKTAVYEFWQRVLDYVNTIDANNLKVYQDGLLVDGELGRKIIEEGARKGSKNYEIVLDLIKRGAGIRVTEDAALLKEEYEHISKVTHAESPAERTAALNEYELRKDPLTKERDKFVAKTINETLGEGEVGILFIGAHHDVLPHLAPDIVVKQIKDQEKMRAYFKELMHEKNEERFEQLARYIAAPIICAENAKGTSAG